MTAAKEIKVTESYVGLGEEVTNCQTQETRSDCLARRHRGVSSSTVIIVNVITIVVMLFIMIIIIIIIIVALIIIFIIIFGSIIIIVVMIMIITKIFMRLIMLTLELSRPGPRFSPPAAVLLPS